jgi:hypothetical protein
MLRNLDARGAIIVASRASLREVSTMTDFVYILAIVAFFAATVGLVRFCATLLRVPRQR